MKQKIYAVLRIAISLFFIGLLFYLRRGSIGPTVDAIKRMGPSILLGSFAIFILSIILLGTRLKILFQAQGFTLKFPEVIYLTFIGYFFNNFLPTSIGGDVVKAHYASKKTKSKLNSFVSIFMDRFIGFLTLFLLAGLSLIFSHSYISERSLIWITLAVLAVLLSILAILFNERVARIFPPRLHDAVNAFKDKKVLMGRAFLTSFVAQIMAFLVIYLFAKGIGSFISMKIVLLLMPLVAIVSMLPSINGLGIRESAIYFLFGPYVGYENAFALSILWLFMLFTASIIGGISYLFGTKYREGIR